VRVGTATGGGGAKKGPLPPSPPVAQGEIFRRDTSLWNDADCRIFGSKKSPKLLHITQVVSGDKNKGGDTQRGGGLVLPNQSESDSYNSLEELYRLNQEEKKGTPAPRDKTVLSPFGSQIMRVRTRHLVRWLSGGKGKPKKELDKNDGHPPSNEEDF